MNVADVNTDIADNQVPDFPLDTPSQLQQTEEKEPEISDEDDEKKEDHEEEE